MIETQCRFCLRSFSSVDFLAHHEQTHHAEKLKAEPVEPAKATHDPVNHPKHYTSHPAGIECIQVTEHMSFNIGNVVKYLWRADEKGAAIEDLKKASWYLNREIEKRERS